MVTVYDYVKSEWVRKIQDDAGERDQVCLIRLHVLGPGGTTSIQVCTNQSRDEHSVSQQVSLSKDGCRYGIYSRFLSACALAKAFRTFRPVISAPDAGCSCWCSAAVGLAGVSGNGCVESICFASLRSCKRIPM